jgi:hypothetical protein
MAPPELAPTVPDWLTSEQGIALWMDLMGRCELFLLGGFQRRLGPEGDIQGAYREWYAEQMEEHDRTMIHLLKELGRRETNHAS